MKRDMDVCRAILLALEDSPDPVVTQLPGFDGYEKKQIQHHAKILSQAGLVDMTVRTSEFICYSLTWEGHEFIDAARNQTLWNKVKKTAFDKAGSVPFEILKRLLIKAVERLIETSAE